MELCKISVFSDYKKQYGDIIFVVTAHNGNMVDLMYLKSKDDDHFTEISLPVQDIVVIQLPKKAKKNEEER